MLWFLHVAIDAGFEAMSYEDAAEGVMTTNEQGRQWISRITLHPQVQWVGGQTPDPSAVARLHELANDQCFIANSIKTKVIIFHS